MIYIERHLTERLFLFLNFRILKRINSIPSLIRKLSKIIKFLCGRNFFFPPLALNKFSDCGITSYRELGIRIVHYSVSRFREFSLTSSVREIAEKGGMGFATGYNNFLAGGKKRIRSHCGGDGMRV